MRFRRLSLLVFLVGILALLGIIYGRSYLSTILQTKAFPFIGRDSMFMLYDLKEEKVYPMGYKMTYGGGPEGETIPAPAPNLFITAFIDQSANKLYLLPHNSRKPRKISEYVEYITAWSPDSTKLIYYIDIENYSYMSGEVDESKPKDPNRPKAGHYLYDLKKNTRTFLPGLENPIEFLDNSHVLMEAGANRDRMAIYDIQTFKMDAAAITNTFDFYGYGQFNISADAKYWAFRRSVSPYKTVTVEYAPFPAKMGKMIAWGTWAEVQGPKISPDGTKIIYIHSRGLNQSHDVVLYDISKNTSNTLVEGSNAYWIDFDSIAVVSRSFMTYGVTQTFSIYTVSTRTSKQFHTYTYK